MNLILFEPREVGRPLAPKDPRAIHLKGILRLNPGDEFEAGVIEGLAGKLTFLGEGPEGLSDQNFSCLKPPHLFFQGAPLGFGGFDLDLQLFQADIAIFGKMERIFRHLFQDLVPLISKMARPAFGFFHLLPEFRQFGFMFVLLGRLRFRAIA